MKMFLKRISIITVLILSFLFSCSSCDKKGEVSEQSNETHYTPGLYPNQEITDGPFMSKSNGGLKVRWIEKGKEAKEELVTAQNSEFLHNQFGLEVGLNELLSVFDREAQYVQEYEGVNKYLALSDIHGQYHIFVDLLKQNGVIDEQLNWIYGTGHLIINGDIFDRGDGVTEALWLTMDLEYQAKKAGGKVHYTLGNHELMVLKNDLRYVAYKYSSTARLLNTGYAQLYSKSSVIGSWLRTKPVMLKINNDLFVHAGASPELVRRNMFPAYVNELFSTRIIDYSNQMIEQSETLKFLKGSYGPVWYRGYFNDGGLSTQSVNQILEHFGVERIIVGHTSMDNICFYNEQKIIAIDCSIKKGEYGEVLIYNNGEYRIAKLQP